MRFGEVCARGDMEMSALLKSEDSTFLPSGSHSVKSTGTDQGPVPASQPARDEGHIYYMPCSHNTCSEPRWQGLESALKVRNFVADGEKK